jgi:hypothetical protein
MQRAARASALARFAFWTQAQQSHASFHLMRRIEDCDASALNILTTVGTNHGFQQTIRRLLRKLPSARNSVLKSP